MTEKYRRITQAAEPLFNNHQLAAFTEFLRETNLDYGKTVLLNNTQPSSIEIESEAEPLNPTFKNL